MTWLESIILGIVEGLTEFLPISSTGHLVLVGKLLGLPENSSLVVTFQIVIQLGAILAVVVLYWRNLLVDWRTMQRIAVALVPALVGGFLLYKLVTQRFMHDAPLIMWSLFLGGCFMILFERFHGERTTSKSSLAQITFIEAFLIGMCQIVALVPGVSRATATVFGGLAVGLNRRTAVEFSFLLAVPTMAAASAYQLYRESSRLSFGDVEVLAIGFVTAFVVALAAIKFLLRFIRTHTFAWFGVYRIVAAIIFGLLLWRS